MEIKEYEFDTHSALFDHLLKDVMGGLEKGLSKNGAATMILAGGSSPRVLYEKMAQQEFGWPKIHFGLSDERWVAQDHAESNEKFIRETLLTGPAAAAQLTGLKSDAENIGEGRLNANEAMKQFSFPFDITLLGMGEDGHTASLFPGSPDLMQALNSEELCEGMKRGPDEASRITLTLKALLNSKEIKLLIFGKEKWRIYQQAKLLKTAAYPISFILHQDQCPVSVYWAEVI